MDVIGFGAVNLDETYSIRSLSALSGLSMAPGSEQTIDGDAYREMTRLLEKARASKSLSSGGQAANTLYALARLGFRTAIIGSVGTDEEHHRLRAVELPGPRNAGVIRDEKGLIMTVRHGRTRVSGKVPLCLNVLLHSCSRESSEGLSVYRLAYGTG